MRSGPMRDRVLVERPVDLQDALGAPIKGWEAVATVQAQVGFISGREYFGSERADLGECTTRITIREVPGIHIDPEMRITDEDTGAVYNVVAVLPSTHREMITIAAKSGAALP